MSYSGYLHPFFIYEVFIYDKLKDIGENEADFVHFGTIHGSENTFPKFIRYFIEFEIIPKFWNVCDSPETHSTEAQVLFNLNILGIKLNNRIFADFKTIGPAHFSIDIHSDIRIMPQIYSTINVITNGDHKQSFYMKWYSMPSILGHVLAKILIQFFGKFFVSSNKFLNTIKFKNIPLILLNL